MPGVRPQPHAARQEAAALPLLPPPGGWIPARVGHRRAARLQQPLHLAHGPPQRPRTPPLCGSGIAVREDGRAAVWWPCGQHESCRRCLRRPAGLFAACNKACNKRTPTLCLSAKMTTKLDPLASFEAPRPRLRRRTCTVPLTPLAVYPCLPSACARAIDLTASPVPPHCSDLPAGLLHRALTSLLYPKQRHWCRLSCHK